MSIGISSIAMRDNDDDDYDDDESQECDVVSKPYLWPLISFNCGAFGQAFPFSEQV